MDAFSRRPRKPFVGIALAAVAGIALGELVRWPVLPVQILVVGAAVFVLVKPRRSFCWALTLLVFALLHTMRHGESAGPRFARTLSAPVPTDLRGIVWSEPDVFAEGAGPQAATFWARIEQATATPSLAGELCLVRWLGNAPVYGDRIAVRGSAEALEPPANPGQFDSARWLARQGIHFQVSTRAPGDCTIVGHRAGQPLRHFAIASRGWIKERLDYGLPPDPEISTLLSSMVLGMRGATMPELKELFHQTGTLHLFAVSGLNVGMLAVIAWYLLKPFPIGKKGGALLIVPFLATYAVIVGMSASCVRATVVAAFILLAPLFERDAVPLNSLAAAAVAILGWDTNELFNPGFQLSFVLVMAILAFSRPVQKWCEKPTLPDDFIPRRLWTPRQRAWAFCGKTAAATVAVGLAAWVGSVFFMWGYFHLVSPVALLANLVAVPIAFCILALGLFSLVTSALFLAPLAALANYANWLCAKLLILSVQFFADFPSGHFYAEWPRFGESGACEVVALDVGDGAAIHLRADGGDWMVDAGRQRDYTRVLIPYLRSRGINRLDGLLLTHGDTAHVGGATALFNDFAPAWIGDTAALDRSPTRRAFHAHLAAAGQGRRFFVRGDVIPLSERAQLRVLYPPPDWPRNHSDDRAMVLRLEAAGKRILMLSDVGFAVEQWLMQEESDLRADVLIKGWAAHDISGTADFITAVGPNVVVCSARPFRSDTSDFPAWAEALRARGITVLSQPECGAVRARVGKDGTLRVETWR